MWVGAWVGAPPMINYVFVSERETPWKVSLYRQQQKPTPASLHFAAQRSQGKKEKKKFWF